MQLPGSGTWFKHGDYIFSFVDSELQSWNLISKNMLTSSPSIFERESLIVRFYPFTCLIWCKHRPTTEQLHSVCPFPEWLCSAVIWGHKRPMITNCVDFPLANTHISHISCSCCFGPQTASCCTLSSFLRSAQHVRMISSHSITFDLTKIKFYFIPFLFHKIMYKNLQTGKHN